MSSKFRIVTKFFGRGNVLDIGLASSDGELLHIGRIYFPDDGQLSDNVRCSDEIGEALQRRFRKSV